MNTSNTIMIRSWPAKALWPMLCWIVGLWCFQNLRPIITIDYMSFFSEIASSLPISFTKFYAGKSLSHWFSILAPEPVFWYHNKTTNKSNSFSCKFSATNYAKSQFRLLGLDRICVVIEAKSELIEDIFDRDMILVNHCCHLVINNDLITDVTQALVEI